MTDEITKAIERLQAAPAPLYVPVDLNDCRAEIVAMIAAFEGWRAWREIHGPDMDADPENALRRAGWGLVSKVNKANGHE